MNHPATCTKVVLVRVTVHGRVETHMRHCGEPAVGGHEATAWCEEHSKAAKEKSE